MRQAGLGLVAVMLCGCDGYADFQLPEAGPPQRVQIHWSMHSEPVMNRDGARDVLNPSVLRHTGLLWNFYSEYDGRTWHTGAATSTDGLVWKRLGRVISPTGWEGDYIAANGSALRLADEYFYWYQVQRTPRIALARSRDGRAWTKTAAPVLSPGPRGAWDERGVADPYVIRIDGWLYMYFLGQDRARRQRLGVARSRDGISWEKLRSNPILEIGEPGSFDELGLGEPAVWASHGSYWMLYTARDNQENRRIGLARSRDGVHWRRFSDRPVLEGAQPWNSKVVCDPTVLVNGDEIRIWFGGGDRAEPAENLNGQIGYAAAQFVP